MSTKSRNKGKILVVDDQQIILGMISSVLVEAGYEVVCTHNILSAYEFVLLALKTGELFDVALIDLNIGSERGDEFAQRLMNIVPETKVAIITGDPVTMMKLSIVPDSVIIKTDNVIKHPKALIEPVRRLMNMKRTDNSSLPVKIKRWTATRSMSGINSLCLFTPEFLGEGDRQVEKLNLTCVSDNRLIVTSVYPMYPGDDAVPIAVQSTIGCPVECCTCVNWKHERNASGYIVSFVRPLTAQEIIAQVYWAVILSSKVEEALKEGSKLGVVVNFSGPGDGLVYNLPNVLAAIEQLAAIKELQFSFIITSVGRLDKLQEFLDWYVKLPVKIPIKLYWSVTFPNSKVRGWRKPGTAGQSLTKMRDLYEKIFYETGIPITASFDLYKGVNNRSKEVREIVELFKGRPWKIKLMAGCPDSLPGVFCVSYEDLVGFREMLIEAGMLPDDVRIREIYGIEGDAGCGRARPARPASFTLNLKVIQDPTV